MSNTSIMRKFRTIGVASAIFTVGAGIGWQLADLLFSSEPPTPMVASIQFEGARPHDATGREQITKHGNEAVRDPAPALYQSMEEPARNQSGAATKRSDEEREFADALQWAEKYRRQEAERHAASRQLAAAEALRWTEVAEQAKRFGQGQENIQNVITAQVERERKQRQNAQRLALAANVIKSDKASDSVVVHTKALAVTCTHACVARKRPAQPTAHRSRPRVHQDNGGQLGGFICPLQWLQSVMVEPAVKGRGRHTRAA